MAMVVEHCKISPSAETVPDELSLPMVFFDLMWYGGPPNQSLLFFEFPCSKTHFLDVVVPQLKHSLSLTLSHFVPLSGKIVHPLKPGNKPVLRYARGDSVSLTVSESVADFIHLTGNQPRSCAEFYAFAPLLPPATHSLDTMECSVLAVHVTLFAGHGVSLGFATHHAAGDACTVVSFIQAWAIINRSMSEAEAGPVDTRARLAKNNLLPFYDRSSSVAIAGINGLDSLFWNRIVDNSNTVEPPPLKLPVGRARTTFVLKKDEIQRLKKLVLAKCGGVKHLSSFTVTCALVWVCSAKSSPDGVAEDDPEYFGFAADCRGRLIPPLPANYFGNCVTLAMAELKHGEVTGDNGFVMAAGSIGEAIWEMGEKGVLHGAEDWHKEAQKIAGKRQYGVAGSPRFDFYAADYGWGKPKKFEPLFIDDNGSISLCRSREFEGGLEIGLSKPTAQLEAFAAVFTEVLRDMLSQ